MSGPGTVERPRVLASAEDERRVRALAAGGAAVGVRVATCGGRTLHVRPGTDDLDDLLATFTHTAHVPPVDIAGDDGAVVLVAGCGGGWVVADLLRRLPRARVVGVEASADVASMARRNTAEFGDRGLVVDGRVGAEDGAAGGNGPPASSLRTLVERFGSGAPARGLDAAGVRVAYVFVDLRGGEAEACSGPGDWLRGVGCVRVRAAGPETAEHAAAWLRGAGVTVWANDWGGPVVTGVSRALAARMPRHPVPQCEIDPGPGFW